MRLANKRSFPANRDKWLKVRHEIYEEIMEKGWSPEREAFVQSYGDDTLDASSLIMPLVFFPSPSDPGNFPQAFTHLTLISAAYNLDTVLRSRG